MTKKTLSQKICEVCGIEPEIIEDYDSNQYEVYPDFENNNNNFIKIQELKIKSSNECLGFILWAQDYKFYDKKSFLDSLLCYLDCVQDIYLEDVKQAIREAKWEV